jgi:hypothetical protein
MKFTTLKVSHLLMVASDPIYRQFKRQGCQARGFFLYESKCLYHQTLKGAQQPAHQMLGGAKEITATLVLVST